VVLIGPSGCGKSTFLRCLNQLEQPDAGRITIGGVTVLGGQTPRTAQERELQRRLRLRAGMVFQSFNLFPHLTVLDNVATGPRIVKGLVKEDAELLARELLRKVGLENKADSYPANFRADSSNGWRLRGRWPWSRRSCCSTNRPAPWIRSCAKRSCASCAAWLKKA